MRHPPLPPANVVMNVTSVLWSFDTWTYACWNNCSVAILLSKSWFRAIMKKLKTIGYYIKNNRRTIERINVLISAIGFTCMHILNIGWGEGGYEGVSLYFVQDCLKIRYVLLFINLIFSHNLSIYTSFTMITLDVTLFPQLFTCFVAWFLGGSVCEWVWKWLC